MIKYKIVNRGSLILVIATMVMAFILGCSESRNLGPTEMTCNGSSQDLGGGNAYAFTTIDASGKPIAIGLRMSETALEGLQAEPPNDATGWETIIPLPRKPPPQDMTTSGLTGIRGGIFQMASTIPPTLIFIST